MSKLGRLDAKLVKDMFDTQQKRIEELEARELGYIQSLRELEAERDEWRNNSLAQLEEMDAAMKAAEPVNRRTRERLAEAEAKNKALVSALINIGYVSDDYARPRTYSEASLRDAHLKIREMAREALREEE